MSGLTSKYLEDFGKKICDYFVGVYPCDLAPNIEHLDVFTLIFNESKHDEDGTHFVCIYADKKDIILFDSLGLKCENPFILNFLKSTGRDIIETRHQIQSFDSIFCGYFCLGFVLFMCKKKNINSFFEIFHKTNLKLNDKIIVDMIIFLINKE